MPPANLITKKPYRGVNVFLLSLAGYGSQYWLTFNQAKQLGGVAVDAERIASMRASGASWQTITRQLGISAGTAKRAFYNLSKNPSRPASVSD